MSVARYLKEWITGIYWWFRLGALNYRAPTAKVANGCLKMDAGAVGNLSWEVVSGGPGGGIELQSTTPGTEETGHGHISGTFLAGTLEADHIISDEYLTVNGWLSTPRGTVASAASITDLPIDDSLLELTGVTATTIHGMAAGGADGQRLTLINQTGAALTIKHESVSGTVMIKSQNVADIVFPGKCVLEFIYHSGTGLGTQRWILARGRSINLQSDTPGIADSGNASIDGTFIAATLHADSIESTDTIDGVNITASDTLHADEEVTAPTVTADDVIADSILGNNDISTNGQFYTPRNDVASAASITALDATKCFVKLTGTTATTLHGMSTGHNAGHLTVLNMTGATFTIKNESGSGTVKITTLTGEDVVYPGNCCAEFVYDSGTSRWILTHVSVYGAAVIIGPVSFFDGVFPGL